MPFTRRLPDEGAGKRRAGRLAWAYFMLACFVAVGAGAGFVTGFERVLQPAMPWFFAVATLSWAVLLRFPRAIGLPVLFLALASTLLIPLTARNWHALRGEAHVATLRVLNVAENSHTVEWIHTSSGFISGDPEIHTVEGQGVAVELRVVRVPPGAFMLPADALVRAERLAGLERTEEGMQPGEAVVFRPTARGAIAAGIDGLLLSDSIEGFETFITRADIIRPVLMSDYHLVVKPDGSAEFVRRTRRLSNVLRCCRSSGP